jgi:uncharacterized protein YyaL (SSP411 family)
MLTHLQVKNGTIMRSWSRGKANHLGILSDYAGLILALRAVYEIDFSPSVFRKMREVFSMMRAEFKGDGHLFYDTHASISNLLLRPRSLQDSAVPSGNALSAHAHWLMAQYDHDTQYKEQFENMVKSVYSQASEYPFGFGYWLQMADLMQHFAQQVALVSNGSLERIEPFLQIYRKKYRPDYVIAVSCQDIPKNSEHPGLLDNRDVLNNRPTAYVCQGHTCQQPTNETSLFKDQLKNKKSPFT